MIWTTRRNLILGALGLGALLSPLLYILLRNDDEPGFSTAQVTRGDIVDIVGATGTLQAVTTVQVGSQVSGIIQELHADFNSVVKKGQVIAKLDPSRILAQLGQARANLISARANSERAQASVTDTRQKFARAKELFTQKLISQNEFETAQVNYESAVAQQKSSDASVSQAEANVNQAQVDLDHTIIQTPIDGVVINRNVDVGQTVAASFQAPTLFVIANDLAQMQVNATVDEADIGRVRQAQDVTFRVDAYPERTFTGRVSQVRLQPVTVQNVVTYNTIISVENRDLRLMPGMTATVSIIVNRRVNALRAPAAALRFRPEGFEADRRAAARGEAGGNVRSADAQRERPRGERSSARASGRGAGSRGEAQNRPADRNASAPANNIERGRAGLLFVLNAQGAPQPMHVQTGISDGQYVEVLDGITEGALVITGAGNADTRAGTARPAGSPTRTVNPFAPRFGGR
ncbi:MAG: efflux RND transporter periplasmic adaptor subunit [Vicinamibacteria bacterium]|jgi:HlyD family secretion protein|nr:efflux RND transporter periplasmic adaptor subunit [Vicinamibacteria bacterium]